MREREVAIGNLAASDALGGIQHIADVVENGDVRVLPQDHAGGRCEEQNGRDQIAQCPSGRAESNIFLRAEPQFLPSAMIVAGGVGSRADGHEERDEPANAGPAEETGSA